MAFGTEHKHMTYGNHVRHSLDVTLSAYRKAEFIAEQHELQRQTVFNERAVGKSVDPAYVRGVP